MLTDNELRAIRESMSRLGHSGKVIDDTLHTVCRCTKAGRAYMAKYERQRAKLDRSMAGNIAYHMPIPARSVRVDA